MTPEVAAIQARWEGCGEMVGIHIKLVPRDHRQV